MSESGFKEAVLKTVWRKSHEGSNPSGSDFERRETMDGCYALIVPNYLSDKINEELDAAIGDMHVPEHDRKMMYQEILVYVHEHGEIPRFKIFRKGENE